MLVLCTMALVFRRSNDGLAYAYAPCVPFPSAYPILGTFDMMAAMIGCGIQLDREEIQMHLNSLSIAVQLHWITETTKGINAPPEMGQIAACIMMPQIKAGAIGFVIR